VVRFAGAGRPRLVKARGEGLNDKYSLPALALSEVQDYTGEAGGERGGGGRR